MPAAYTFDEERHALLENVENSQELPRMTQKSFKDDTKRVQFEKPPVLAQQVALHRPTSLHSSHPQNQNIAPTGQPRSYGHTSGRAPDHRPRRNNVGEPETHEQMKARGYDPIIGPEGLPGKKSDLLRSLPSVEYYITYRIAYELWNAKERISHGTLPRDFQDEEVATMQAKHYLANFAAVCPEVQGRPWKDADGLWIYDKGPFDGEILRVWVERFHTTAMPIPPKAFEQSLSSKAPLVVRKASGTSGSSFSGGMTG